MSSLPKPIGQPWMDVTGPWFADYGNGLSTFATMRPLLSKLPWRLLVPAVLGLLGGSLIGWQIGRQALRGVHAPETAPVLASQSGHQTAEFRSEAEVLKRIQARMSRISPLDDQPESESTPSKTKPQPTAPRSLASLSIQIRETRLSTDQLTWSVALKNQGDRPFALLGSNLEVRDDQGRTSVIEPQDLPKEIVAGETVTGQFRVPLLLLEGARQLRIYGTGLPSAGIELPLPSRPLTVPLPPQNLPSDPLSP
jgi:hypothetical protein